MKIKKILCVCFAVLLFGLYVFPIGIFAAELNNPMEHTDVLDDLQKKNYILSQFPKDGSASFVSLLDVDEYAYDAHGDFRYYGIYLYLYNPTGRSINPDTCNVQMSYITTGGTLKPYQKYPLEILSVSGDSASGDTDGLFYKFKVSGTMEMAREVISNLRTYYFSGIELDFGDGLKDYPLSQRWTFTGYQENFGLRKGDADSLFENRYSIEVAEIEIHPASWFTQTSSLGENYRWELSSVYFNIPDYYINQYGNLNDEWQTSGLRTVRGVYTKGMVNGLLISDQEKYREFTENTVFQNLHCSSDYDANKSTTGGMGFAKVLSTQLKGNISTHVINQYDFSFNMIVGDYYSAATHFSISSNRILTECYYPMYSSDLTMSQKQFLKRFQNSNLYFTSSDTLVNSDWGATQNFGYQSYEVSVDQGSWNTAFQTYASKNANRSWLYKFFNKELYADQDGYSVDCAPIVELNTVSLLGSNAAVSQKLYVTNEDAESLKSFYQEKKSGNHVYLMRFDCTPYYSSNVVLQQSSGFVTESSDDARYFEKIIYKDFDILEFEFENSYGRREVVAVSCTPTDVVGGIVSGDNRVDTNPNEPGDQTQSDGWSNFQEAAKKLLMGVVVVSIVLLILQMLGFPLRSLLTVISGVLLLPFRLLEWLFRALNKLFRFGKKTGGKISNARRQKKQRAAKKSERENKE